MSQLNFAFCVCYWGQIVPKCNIKQFHKGVKQNLDLINQIYLLWKSLQINVTSVDFQLYVFTIKEYVTNEIRIIFEKIGINLIELDTKLKSHFRPLIYTYHLDCDYKVILDADIMFLNDFSQEDIDHIIKYDVMGMYGHRNINYNMYINILKGLSLKITNEIEETKSYASNRRWTTLNTYKYNINKTDQRLFPYFNNGMIIIKNSLSEEFGKLWEEKRLQMAKLNLYGINLGQSGELTIGLVANHLTDNWNALPKGFNLVCSNMTKKM